MRPTRLLLIWLGVLLGLSVLLGALGALQIKVPDTLHAVTWGLLLALLGVAERFLPKSVRRVLSPFSAERGVPYGVALAAGGIVAILASMAEG